MTDPATVLERLLAAPPLLGGTRLLCIDGPAGSGKTTLAGKVAELCGARVLRMDDLYPGWSGLFAVDPHVLGILEPLAVEEPGRYRRYDWPTDAYAEEHLVEPVDLLVLEGVGAGNRRWSGWSRSRAGGRWRRVGLGAAAAEAPAAANAGVGHVRRDKREPCGKRKHKSGRA